MLSLDPLAIIKFILSSVKRSNFYGWVVIIILMKMGTMGYFVYKLYEEKDSQLSEFERETVDSDVALEMRSALNACGDGSFLFWVVLENHQEKIGKYLRFKEALSCNIDRGKRLNDDKDNCAIDIKFNNSLYLSKHFINAKTLRFIENDPVMPNGEIFEERVVIHLPLIDLRGEETEEMRFLQKNAPDFYNIINKRKVAIQDAFVIKVRETKGDKVVIYVFYLAFVPESERSCVNVGSYLMNLYRKSIKNL